MELTISNPAVVLLLGVGIGIVVARVWAFFTMRNCDRFDNFDEAHVAFLRENPAGTMYELDDWLFKRVFGSRRDKEKK